MNLVRRFDRPGRRVRLGLLGFVVVVAAVSGGCVGGQVNPPDPSASAPSLPVPACGSAGGFAAAPRYVHLAAGPQIACTMPGPTGTFRPRAYLSASTWTRDDVNPTIATGKAEYRAGEPIDVVIQLVYSGPSETLAVAGSGDGLVRFNVRQIDGDLEANGVQTADCRATSLKRGDVHNIRFVKTGGYSEAESPAQVAFMEAYLEGRDLVLPPGLWEIVAQLGYGALDCGNWVGAGVSVVVLVNP